ncbi:5-formyltetrahydrofolate cyclo-ligase [bacterium]|nr:5-formyltetrahydrofolate cyclo-ligase [bacterium]
MQTEKYGANNILRKKIYAMLGEMKYKTEAERAIFEKIVACKQYIEAKKIFCYYAKENEVNTLDIIEDSLKKGKQVGLPITTEILTFVSVNKDTVYKAGKYGITEPSYGEEIMGADVIIVPMVAFDRACNRLGHGKGYYDRFLANERGFKIGIAFSLQEGEITTLSHDIPMDMVITEKEVIYKVSEK